MAAVAKIKPTLTSKKRARKSYGKIIEVTEMPNLLELQRSSYAEFLQMDEKPENRKDMGLQAVFNTVFPIYDFNKTAQLEFVSYQFEEPKYDIDECVQRDLTWAAPLKVTLRLVTWDVEENTGAKSIRDIKEQDVYMGDIPLMTEQGTFIVNGTERVIVSQMHRSPGVFFDHDNGKSHSSGKFLYAARIIPYHGSWLDFEFDPKDLLNVRIDRRRKLPVTTLLLSLDNADTVAERKRLEQEDKILAPEAAVGLSSENILNYFYDQVVFTKDKKGWTTAFDPKKMRGVKLAFNLVDAKTGDILAEAGEKLTARKANKIASDGVTHRLAHDEELIGRYFAEDLINEETGEVIAEAGDEITKDALENFASSGMETIKTLDIDYVHSHPYILNTLHADKNGSREDALLDIYRVMRPGEPPTLEAADALFQSLFFDSERYDLSPVGRVKMNARLGLDVSDDMRVLRVEDILAIIKELVEIKSGRGEIDDIDHLGNRRVRSVGELLENQYRLGVLRMERAIKERMSSAEIDTLMPADLINAKPAAAAVREFFGSSQLSQFMDQVNPLSTITHKRRLSALGPGGLTRERAGFEVRDVHPTHYGRICPIETPEGPNIGLINSLATFARVNKYGFIESPYRKVVDSKVTDEVIYLSAIEEGKYTIAQANAEMDESGKFVNDLVTCRVKGEFQLARPEDIQYMDVSPKQLVSVAASLIPFLENDDANRALMGSNMMRQGVPLIRPEAPLVGTGMEATVARDSGSSLVARRPGVVAQVDANRIVVRVEKTSEDDAVGVDIYKLRKFERSNQSTCINQRPLVKVGDRVEANDIIADGPSTDLGELALGKNVLVAFMPWMGYNFEDSILLSERIVKDDVYTSIHIEEYEVMSRDTKLGQEDITRDIPNVGEEALRNLDEAGIVYVGAKVKPGDILVGKVTPKGETAMTPEEKLLRAIFGEKSADVRDSSLRMPPGAHGTVVDVRVFSRRGIEKDERTLAIEAREIERYAKDRDDERKIYEAAFHARLKDLMDGQIVTKAPKETNLKKGTKLDRDMLDGINQHLIAKIEVEDAQAQDAIEAAQSQHDKRLAKVQARFDSRVEKLQRGDEMLPGVMKMVKVFVAVKRKIQPGDKMAGRHGNKGVVSKIIPVEDMPHLADGTPVDIVLNPLGVPSRMNVGQILETHLGWAAHDLGRKITKMIEDNQSAKGLRDTLKDIYGEDEYNRKIKMLSDDEIKDMCHNLKNGVPMATPVFDGVKEDDLNEALAKSGLPSSAQVTLYDGRTGEQFDRPVTVGFIYMLKLAHMVDDKIHARSIGPYSLVTQQPLGGKAQFGGQRLGEMEVWALQAYGAAYTLQEMLTVKSDDVTGRTKVYESIIRGDENFESGIPESFNVLVKEMRSLGLDVALTHSKESKAG